VRELNEIIDGTIKVLEDMKRSGVTHVDVFVTRRLRSWVSLL